MSKTKNTPQDELERALAMFEPNFRVERNQGIQETRELLSAFIEFDVTFTTEDPVDVKKPL